VVTQRVRERDTEVNLSSEASRIWICFFQIYFSEPVADTPRMADLHDTPWWVAQAKRGGGVVVIKGRSHVPPSIQTRSFPWLTVIKWPYEPGRNDLPCHEDFQTMKQFEDLVEEGLVRKGVCILSACLTGDGAREWEYYIRDREEFEVHLNRTLAAYPRFPIQIEYYNDPNWESFHDILKMVGKAPGQSADSSASAAAQPQSEPAQPASDADVHIENVRTLAWVLSSYDRELLAEVDLSIFDPATYSRQYAEAYRLRPGTEAEPSMAAFHALVAKQYVGWIDWRAEPEELVQALTPVLRTHGIAHFDWSFLDALVESEDVEALKSVNLLNLVRDKVAAHGLRMIQWDMGFEAYVFALVDDARFAQIKDVAGKHYGFRTTFR